MRPRIFRTYAINVVAQPHPKGIYEQLFDRLIQARPAVKIARDQYGKFTSTSKLPYLVDFEGKNQTVFFGLLHIYSKIQADKDWFNESTETIVDDKQELDAIKRISHLGPNDRALRYAFYPDHHMFIFDSQANNTPISASTVERLLRNSLTPLIEQFQIESIKFTIEPVKSKVDEIINMTDLGKIELLLHRPNPDALPSNIEDDIFKDMDEEGVSEESIELKRSKSKPIKLNKRRTDIIRVASRNGYVRASGYDNGKRKTIATNDHPFLFKQFIKFEKNDDIDAPKFFLQHAVRMLEIIKKSLGVSNETGSATV